MPGELIGALPAAELVPGDLMYLRVGDKVCILYDNAGYRIDISILSTYQYFLCNEVLNCDVSCRNFPIFMKYFEVLEYRTSLNRIDISVFLL